MRDMTLVFILLSERHIQYTSNLGISLLLYAIIGFQIVWFLKSYPNPEPILSDLQEMEEIQDRYLASQTVFSPDHLKRRIQ